ncbi:MAG: hypothetical protein JWL64_1929 [Frankiales bacterium]|nr:hypothetical protein [Frankiales bacterium]
MTTPLLDPSDLYHVGHVVRDLEVARDRWTAVAGYRWTRTLVATVPLRLAEGVRELEFRYTYSLQAPHVELVQEIPGTLWAAVPGNAAHHVAYFVDDFADTSQRLVDAGFAIEAIALPDGAHPGAFAYQKSADGVRLELVDRALLPDWPAFLARATATRPRPGTPSSVKA